MPFFDEVYVIDAEDRWSKEFRCQRRIPDDVYYSTVCAILENGFFTDITPGDPSESWTTTIPQLLLPCRQRLGFRETTIDRPSSSENGTRTSHRNCVGWYF